MISEYMKRKVINKENKKMTHKQTNVFLKIA